MKYSLIFAATAAAYDAYGGYGKAATSSHVVKASPSTKPCSSTKPVGYTTIYPGYNKEPVTVTAQYQPYPTCVSAGYGSKNCEKWESDKYVSTTIKDCENKPVTITKVQQPVTVYHIKKTITHTTTTKYGYPTASAVYAQPTGSSYKNGTEGCWYELYEKIEEVPYNQLGPHAIPGYHGSGLYPEGDWKQPVHVKEYKGGKWSEYDHEYSYAKPEAEVTTYAKPGVYTVPAKDVTVDYPVTHAAVATKTAKAGETCTYGGQYIEAKETGYVTGAYGAYLTKVYGDKTETETVIKYTTVYVTSTGKVEIAKPTITVYDHDTEVAYPTAKCYSPGVYHYDAKTVTVTKAGEAYTCKYEQTKTYEPTAKHYGGYPAYPTSTPVKDNSYGYKPSATPKKPTEDEDHYPHYPVKSNSTQVYPASTPVAVYSKPYGADHGYGSEPKYTPAVVSVKSYGSYPAKSTSSPCPESSVYKAEPYKPAATPVKPSAYVPEPYKPAATSVKPSAYVPEPYKPAATPVKPSAYVPEPYKPAATPVTPAASAYTHSTGYAKRGNMVERRQAIAANAVAL